VVSLIIVLSAAILVVSARVRWSLVAYIALTFATLWLVYPEASASRLGLLFFIALAIVKIAVGPAAVLWLIRANALQDTLSPAVSVAARILVSVLALFIGYAAGNMAAFSSMPLSNIVFYSIFSSMFIVILHRSLLSHVIGLLVLGSAITLAGAVFAPALPGGIELADTFDAVIATFVALSVARALVAHDPNLDVRSLRELRG
jgi:hydrogenase-4 membrane subunit HyfE